MSLSKMFFLVFFVSFLPFSNLFAESNSESSPKSLTDLLRPHWPYKAFWAIPAIDSIKPRLALKTNLDGQIIGRSRCLEIDNLEQRRVYNRLAKMTNEQLHRVACKAMKMAIKNVDSLPIFEKLNPSEEILLKFDFSKGIVSSSKNVVQPIQVESEDTENSG